MTFYVGTDKVKGVYVGSDEVKKIYIGTDLVWEKPRLPVEYQEVEWIASSGTQAIKTNYVVNSSSIMIVDAELGATTSSSAVTVFFGASNTRWWVSSSNYNNYLIFTGEGNNLFRIGVGTGFSNSGSTYTANERHTYKLANKTGYIDNVAKVSLSSETLRTVQEFVVFAYLNHTSSTFERFSTMKLYNCQIYEGTTLMIDLVPCYEKSTGTIGLYDLVNDTFYDNDGTGTFTKGADV